MELDPRKMSILTAIVEEYIRTGEPVGSKSLSQMLEFQVSPATIRNEMAALFDMGLLEQPHTSSGRVPSHLGLRVYIDRLMRLRPLGQYERDSIDALFNIANPDPDKLLEDAAAALAEFTKCATISSTITPESVSLRRVDILPVAQKTALLVVVASNGVIRSKACRTEFNVTPRICEFFSRFSNGHLAGVSLSAISARYIKSVVVAMDEYSELFTPILLGVYELCREISEGQLFINGETNLLSYNELSQIANLLLPLIARREDMQSLVSTAQGIQVTVGRENTYMELSNASVMVVKFPIGEQGEGAIGLIGPLRLDYARLIPHVEYFAKRLGQMLSESYEQQ